MRRVGIGHRQLPALVVKTHEGNMREERLEDRRICYVSGRWDP
jgi:hypothetical protein